MRGYIPVIALALCTTGCASIVSGSSEEIVVNTNPSDAYCKLIRKGMPVGEVAKTPGAVTVKKTKYDLTIQCEKAGFHKATYYDKSGIQGSTFGNIILGGGIGWAIDSASGSDNHYTSPVNITMVPLSEPAPKPIYSSPPEKKKTNDTTSGDESSEYP